MKNAKRIANIILEGGVGVMPTDTIYGIVGSALLPSTVERIYTLRKRNKKKPMIVLISSLLDLRHFSIRLTPSEQKTLRRIWPNKVSVVLPCTSKEFTYIHRGMKSIVFRVPKLKWLTRLIQETGPLVAPSANFEGEAPATTLREAKKYFGKRIDFYLDGGVKKGSPSTIITFQKGKVKILREGAVKL